MIKRDPESKLQSYIKFRSEYLPRVFPVVVLAVSAVVFYLMWDSQNLYPLEKHFDALKKIFQNQVTLSEYINLLETKDILIPIVWHITISFLSGLFAAVLISIPWWKRPDRMDWIYIKEGVAVFNHVKTGLKALKKEIGIWKKKGIQIYKGKGGSFRLPFDLETKGGLMFVGSVGSGKTASMLHSINSIIERGDKAIIYDYKGDMTSWLLGRKYASLVGFQDKRSDPWWIAKDINSPLLAREIAQTLIKETSDPVWSDNARDVLSGVIEYLIATKPNVWGFQDVSDLLNQDRQELAMKIKSIGHGGFATIDKPKDDKSANSVMSTVRSGTWIFDDLGRIWKNPTEGFSIRDWVRDENPEKRIIILRNYPDVSATSYWLLGIMFNQLFGEVLALRDSKKRRVWCILDEFATLPAIPRLPECLVASRSKGFRFLCGIQNFASMRETYGREIAQTIISQFTTKIICRVNDEDTATALAKDMGGERKISKAEVTKVTELNEEGKPITKWHVKWKDVTEPTMLNNSIMSLPDPTKTGSVTAWLYIAGFPICKLEWDFLDIKETAPIDVPVIWDAAFEYDDTNEEEYFKPKAFPEGSKLSKPIDVVDDFENLDDVDFPDIGDE